jgi:GTP-binding protein
VTSAAIERVGRAAILAALSTLTALGFHMSAGGHAPSAAGVLVPLALSFVVAVHLAGVRLTRWRVAVAAGVSQLAFHFLFGLGSGAVTAVATGEPLDPHAGHDLGAVAAAAHTGDAMAGMDMSSMHSMPLAHIAAAIITYLLIRRGDVVLAWLSTTARALRAALAARLTTPSVPVVWHVPGVLPTVAAPSGLLARALPAVGLRAPPRCV